MPDELVNQQLNLALIRLRRNLLQYAGECWVWASSARGRERDVLDRIVADQSHAVAALSDLLVSRHHSIDFGTYPTEFTDLHYVSLDFLHGQLVAEQTRLVQDLEAIEAAVAGDPRAVALLSEIVIVARGHLQQLREVTAL
jgi:hypothetical protein